MGIFKKRSTSSNNSEAERELYRYYERDLAQAFEAEYSLYLSGVKERITEGLSGKDFADYEAAQLQSLVLISGFMNKTLGGDLSNLQTKVQIDPNWVDVKIFVDDVYLKRELRVQNLVKESIELVIYFADEADSGGLIEMPRSSRGNSLAYRSYLLGNNINSNLAWGWEKATSFQEKTDSAFTQFIARFITLVHDKGGRNRILDGAVHLAAGLIFEWEVSPERKSKP